MTMGFRHVRWLDQDTFIATVTSPDHRILVPKFVQSRHCVNWYTRDVREPLAEVRVFNRIDTIFRADRASAG